MDEWRNASPGYSNNRRARSQRRRPAQCLSHGWLAPPPPFGVRASARSAALRRPEGRTPNGEALPAPPVTEALPPSPGLPPTHRRIPVAGSAALAHGHQASGEGQGNGDKGMRPREDSRQNHWRQNHRKGSVFIWIVLPPSLCLTSSALSSLCLIPLPPIPLPHSPAFGCGTILNGRRSRPDAWVVFLRSPCRGTGAGPKERAKCEQFIATLASPRHAIQAAIYSVPVTIYNENEFVTRKFLTIPHRLVY